MGHTLPAWTTKVLGLVRDAGMKDLDASGAEIGIRSAFAQYSNDRPRRNVVEVAGAGSSYFAYPTGWATDWSKLISVEYPARLNPPVLLDDQSYVITRDPADVTVEKILLLSATPSASQFVRFAFTVPWPYPTSTAADDKVDDQAYEAVAALAAARAIVPLVAEASRSRQAAIPTDFVDGGERTQRLTDAAARYQAIYDRFMGYATTDPAGGAQGPVVPASARFDFDPAYGSLFHGGRR
jgi:hypothetical protein